MQIVVRTTIETHNNRRHIENTIGNARFREHFSKSGSAITGPSTGATRFEKYRNCRFAAGTRVH
jgi:hypothetical protein